MTATKADATESPVPFGCRFLVSPPPAVNEEPTLAYSDELQINVNADGNPWHALAVEVGETRTETGSGDGSGPGSDAGTDLY